MCEPSPGWGVYDHGHPTRISGASDYRLVARYLPPVPGEERRSARDTAAGPITAACAAEHLPAVHRG